MGFLNRTFSAAAANSGPDADLAYPDEWPRRAGEYPVFSSANRVLPRDVAQTVTLCVLPVEISWGQHTVAPGRANTYRQERRGSSKDGRGKWPSPVPTCYSANDEKDYPVHHGIPDRVRAESIPRGVFTIWGLSPKGPLLCPTLHEQSFPKTKLPKAVCKRGHSFCAGVTSIPGNHGHL